MVYGLGGQGNFNSIIKLVDKLPVFPKVKNQRSMIYIDNLTEFVKRAIDNEICGVYMPQNKEYMNTGNMAKWISEVREKKIHISGVLGFGVKMVMPFVRIAKKGFGSLIYNAELESMNYDYCIVEPEQSVKKSIKNEEQTSER